MHSERVRKYQKSNTKSQCCARCIISYVHFYNVWWRKFAFFSNSIWNCCLLLFFYFPCVIFVICIPFTCTLLVVAVGCFFFKIFHVNCKYSYFVCVRIYFYADLFFLCLYRGWCCCFILLIRLSLWLKEFWCKNPMEKWETITVNLHVTVYAEYSVCDR